MDNEIYDKAFREERDSHVARRKRKKKRKNLQPENDTAFENPAFNDTQSPKSDYVSLSNVGVVRDTDENAFGANKQAMTARSLNVRHIACICTYIEATMGVATRRPAAKRLVGLIAMFSALYVLAYLMGLFSMIVWHCLTTFFYVFWSGQWPVCGPMPYYSCRTDSSSATESPQRYIFL